MRNCWKILGIEATDDLKLIKMAYAERVKTVHPEDNPEGFKNLQLAYKQALQLAKRRAVNSHVVWHEPASQLEQEHLSSVFDNLNVEDLSLEEQVLLEHQEELDFAHLDVYEQEINDDGAEENDFDFSNLEIEGKEERDNNLYAGLRLQEFLQVTEDYLDWLEEQWKGNPTYQQLLNHLISDDFRRYVIYRPFQERLTQRLKDFKFEGPASDRAIVFDFLQQYGLKALQIQMKLNLHRRLHQEFSGSLSEEAVADDSFLSRLLAGLDLVSPFDELLAFVETDHFAYCAKLDVFRQAVTKHLKNYYFYGEWTVRSKLVGILRGLSMGDLADFIANVGLKDPSRQAGQATKGYET